MSSKIQTTFVLTGPYAGHTVRLGSQPYQFEEGRLTISAPAEEVALHARFLERNWEAYPEGHEKLREAQDGKRDFQKDSQRDSQSPIRGDGESAGEGPEAGGAAPVVGGDGAPEGGEAGGVANGDGHAPELNEKLLRAVLSLDPGVDDHWTQDGQPAMRAVEQVYGSADITRADVKAAAPEVTRGTARAAKPTEES